MSRKDKLAAKLLDRKRNVTWNELTALLQYLGYREAKKGKPVVHEDVLSMNTAR